MFNVLNKNYTNFQQISLIDTFKLSTSSTDNGLKKIDKFIFGTRDTSKIESLRNNLKNIQDSITTYSESLKNATPFSQLSFGKKIRYVAIEIANFFNLTNYKINTLNSSLPHLIAAIEEIYKNFIDYEIELNKSYNHIENSAVQLKLRQITLLQREFKKVNPDKKAWDETAHEVHDYIINKFKQLKAGDDVAIQPGFYHSTNKYFPTDDNFSGILKGKTINKSSSGVQGAGVYLSTNIEFGHYGPVAIAVDPEGLQGSAICYPAVYSNIHRNMGKYQSIWVCYEHDVELSPKIVPLITADTRHDCETYAKKVKETVLEGTPVVTRKACYRISDLFEKIIASQNQNPAILNIPKNWKVKNLDNPLKPRKLTNNRAV